MLTIHGATLLQQADKTGSRASSNSNFGPHRLTHCYLVDERDRARFAEVGAVADFQLSPTSSLTYEYKRFLSGLILGDTRASQLQPNRATSEAGATVTISSDWGADILSPFAKLSIAMGILEDIHTVLLTIHGATLLQQADKTGSLAVGKDADFIVFDKDIFQL